MTTQPTHEALRIAAKRLRDRFELTRIAGVNCYTVSYNAVADFDREFTAALQRPAGEREKGEGT